MGDDKLRQIHGTLYSLVDHLQCTTQIIGMIGTFSSQSHTTQERDVGWSNVSDSIAKVGPKKLPPVEKCA